MDFNEKCKETIYLVVFILKYYGFNTLTIKG